jgi:hypothetical protein
MSKTGKAPATAAPNLPAVRLPSPLNSPPFPNSDWSYGGSPEIGAPDTNVPPLMEALYGGSNGEAWEQSRVKVYGWLEGSFNLSTSHDSNYPAAYDIFANRPELDQAVLYVERLPDTVQTDHFDWGFHLSGLFGTSYRFTTNLGYFSGQLLDDHREYGFDPVLEYVDLYIPQVAEGLNIRVGRFISIPGIEAQLAPNNYVYTHSLLYSVDPFTDTGILAPSNSMTTGWSSWGSPRAMTWLPGRRTRSRPRRPASATRSTTATTMCILCERSQRRPVRLQQPADVRQHLVPQVQRQSWHMATEAWYMYQRMCPAFRPDAEKGTNGAFCSAGQIRCLAPEWADGQLRRKTALGEELPLDSLRFPGRHEGPANRLQDRYAEETLMWGHWVGIPLSSALNSDSTALSTWRRTITEPGRASFSWRWT